jgi:sec-independent protein translocase protein TatA
MTWCADSALPKYSRSLEQLHFYLIFTLQEDRFKPVCHMLLFGIPNGFELLIIAFIVLLLFGKNKLPELARGLGSGIHEFRKGISGQLDHDSETDRESEPTPVKKVKSVKVASAKTQTTKVKTKSK